MVIRSDVFDVMSVDDTRLALHERWRWEGIARMMGIESLYCPSHESLP